MGKNSLQKYVMTSQMLLYDVMYYLYYGWPCCQKTITYLQVDESTSEMHGVNMKV